MGTMTTTNETPDAPTWYVRNPLDGEAVQVDTGAYGDLELVLPSGDVIQFDTDADGVTIRNAGRRLSSGLAVFPRAHNSLRVVPAP